MPFGNKLLLLALLAASTQANTNKSDLPDGSTYGNVIIRNNCDYKLYVWSVGVHRLNGFRELPKAGLHTPEDDERHEIDLGANWTEPYRTTCFKENSTHQYCPASDLGAGQGVSLKISKEENPGSNITQLEYTLTKNIFRKDKFFRFDYDISLLDCGKNTTIVTDACAGNNKNDPDLKKKIDECPGFGDGFALTFEPMKEDQNKSTNCPPLYCSGEEKCEIIYMWDPTRPGEPSMACEREFKGDMVFDLCVRKLENGNRAQIVESQYESWSSASIASYGVGDCTTGPKTQTTPSTTSSTPTSIGSILRDSSSPTSPTPPATTQTTSTVPSTTTTTVLSTVTASTTTTYVDPSSISTPDPATETE